MSNHQFPKRDETTQFSLRPTHSDDIDILDTYISTPLFPRSASASNSYPYSSYHQNKQIYDDSPLPTSALPYIYTDTASDTCTDIDVDVDIDADIGGLNTTDVTAGTNMSMSPSTADVDEIESPSSAVSTSIFPPMYTPTKEERRNSGTRTSMRNLPTASVTYKAANKNDRMLGIVSSSSSRSSNDYDHSHLVSNDDRRDGGEYGGINTNMHTPEQARKQWKQQHHNMSMNMNMNMNTTNQGQLKGETRERFLQSNHKRRLSRISLDNGFSVRITTSQSRVDPSGAPYTAYIMCIESKEGGRFNIEHRYSEFAKLNADLNANDIVMECDFPTKHWAGRIGDWTPASKWAPEKNRDLIRRREKMLDIWMVELCEKFQHTNLLHGELRVQVDGFFRKSSAAIPPCDRPNHISCFWGSFMNSEEDGLIEYDGEARHSGGGIVTQHLGNPVSFTLGSSIRQAAYIIRKMCGTKSTYTLNGDQSDQLIPLDLLHQAKGLCFLTVAKAGFVMSVRGGTGLIIAKRRDGTWTPPSAIGTLGIGWGAMIGGDITTYLIVLNTENAVKVFAQKRSVNLGAELGVTVGPLGRCANGNINADSSGRIVPAYAYAHSKGLFAGISFEGSIGKKFVCTYERIYCIRLYLLGGKKVIHHSHNFVYLHPI